jgi:flagellar basal-body rod modification protein FlgD
MQLSGLSAVTNRAEALVQARAQAQAQAQTNAANSTSGSGSSTSSSSSVGSLTSEQTFLQLLVAQIQNQDPLNPTDSIQFVGQLVQYSELEQLMGINQGIQTLTGDTSATQSNSTNSTNPSSSTNPTTKPAAGA